MNETYQSLAHSRWDSKYHVVFVPKGRRKALFGGIRQKLGRIFHELARQKECQIVEGHVMPGPRPHVRPDSAEICGRLDHWIPERKERDRDRTGVCRQRAELHRRALLGAWLRRFDGGVQPGAGEGVHSQARGRRRTGTLLTSRCPWLTAKPNNNSDRL